MKFACDQCKTKYTIADERVRGKVLKIRCKSCSHVITVREEQPAPERQAASDSTIIGTPETLLPESQRVEPEDWHLSVDGVADGPLRLSVLAQRILAEREGGDKEIFVWRDGFEDWLPPQVVAEVFAAMEQRKSKVKAAQRAPARPPAALPPVSNPRPPASARSQPSSPPRPPARASAASLGAPPRPPTSGRSAGAPPPTPAGSTGSLGAPPPWSPPAVNASARLRASSADVEASSPAASLTPEMKRAPAPEGRGHRDVGALGGPPPPGAAAAQAGGLGGLPPPPSASSADEALDAIGRSPRLPSGGLQLDAAHAVALPSVSSPSQPAPSPIAQLLHAQDAGRAAQGAEAAGPRPTGDPVAGRSSVLDAALSSLGEPPGAPAQPEVAQSGGGRRRGGFDLAISEPSMLIDLSSMAGLKRRRDPGGEPVGEAEGRAGSGAAPRSLQLPVVAASVELPALGAGSAEAAAPVLVMTGPAPNAGNRQLKVVLGAAVCICVVLLGTVAYLLAFRPPGPIVVAPPPDRLLPDNSRRVNDTPVIVPSEPGAAAQLGDGGLSKTPGRKPRQPRPGLDKAAIEKGEALKGFFGNKDDDKPKESVIAAVPRSTDTAARSSVSAEQLAGVVQKNKKALTSCYERFLKHDESLRSARINVALKIGLSGRVTRIDFSGSAGVADTDLGKCMHQMIRRWVFPQSDSDYEFQFPLLLTAS